MMEIRLVVSLYQDGTTVGKLIVLRSTGVDTLWIFDLTDAGAIAQTKIGDDDEFTVDLLIGEDGDLRKAATR
jgi:hypothetical protein